MIGSHNTFTYMRPKQWWAWLLIPTARCQKQDIHEQIKKGIKLIDIRVRYTDKRGWCVCHGLSVYCEAFDAFTIAAVYKLPVRVLIEGKYDGGKMHELRILIRYCNIKVYECRDKTTWQQLFWDVETLPIEQYVGSMQSWYGKVFPFLYTLLNKKKLRKQMDICKENGTTIALFDFI